MHKSLALQICQRCAELVGVQDEAGQVETVLPHLEEGAQLQGAGWDNRVTTTEEANALNLQAPPLVDVVVFFAKTEICSRVVCVPPLPVCKAP